MLKVYPAVFSEDVRGGYYIQFPDIDGVGTQGDTIAEGIEMASDYLGIMLADYIELDEQLPEPSSIKNLKANDNDFLTLITVDLSDYVKDSKMDRTNITIPHWLKVRAEKQGLNISKITTNALLEKTCV